MHQSSRLASFNPLRQSIFVMAVALISFVIISFSEFQKEAHWMVACSGILFFAVCSPILSVFQVNWIRYAATSAALLLVIAVLLMLAAKAFSGISITGMRPYQMIIAAAVVFFFLSMVLARLIRAIFQFTTEEL